MLTKQLLLSSFLLLFSYLSCLAQRHFYIDELGDTISRRKFTKKWHDKDLLLSRWDSIGKTKKRYSTLRQNQFMKGHYDYQTIKTEIEKITSLEIKDHSIFIIAYFFKDDFCIPNRDNIWTSSEIEERKQFLKPIKTTLEDKAIVFICLFEKGIALEKHSKSEKEYFFKDENEFFKKNLFSFPAMCGSYAAIKPNGQTLIRNGEFRADWFSEYLHPENWSKIFPANAKH